MEQNQKIAALRRHFLGWQCRIRQHAARHEAGRPGTGMRPRATTVEGRELASAITVLLVPREPAESTALFRHQGRKTLDPALRYERVVEILADTYFQHPETFDDVMTALFGPESPLAEAFTAAGHCVLEFAQFNQAYRLPCAVESLAPDSVAYEATYWHNYLFNPNLPGAVQVLAFRPDWARASADPGP